MIKFSTSSYKEIEWDNLDQEIDYLEKLTYTEFIEFFQETLLRPNVNRQSKLRQLGSLFCLCCPTPTGGHDVDGGR